MPKRKASPKYMATTKLPEAGIKELQEGIDAIRESKNRESERVREQIRARELFAKNV